jgi:DNA polymerase-3 subunit alpha
MSGKFRSKAEFAKIREKFFDSCARKGYSAETTAEVWRQMESFSGYSFSKAHSASFAVESYQSLFLKTYYPMEFMVAVINNFGGFYRTEIYVHEARRSGARVEAPCVNHSLVLTRIKGDCIYLGFIHVQGLESSLSERIENEREEAGRFRSMEQFLQRLRPGLEQAILLIRCGAFRFTGRSRKELLWEVHVWYNGRSTPASSMPLFSGVSEEDSSYQQELSLSSLSEESPLENAYDELELLGFSLHSPFALSDWSGEFARLPAAQISASREQVPLRPAGEEEPGFGRRIIEGRKQLPIHLQGEKEHDNK